MKTKIILALLATSLAARGEMPVIDPALILQTIEELRLSQSQLLQVTAEVQRLGNPATYKPIAVSEIISSLDATGVGKTWDELRSLASGSNAMSYTGKGLYQAIGQAILTSTGETVAREPDGYKKFDAISKAAVTMEAVMKDTETRRNKVRDQIKTTSEELRGAQTVAEVQKLQAVLAAQSADLAAIDREREGAMDRVLVQKVENDNNAAKQAEARTEERVVDFEKSQDVMGQFLTPNTTPLQIADPRTTP